MKFIRYAARRPRGPASLAAVAALATALEAAPARAVDAISDPLFDFLPSFAGSPFSIDLDVAGATVTYNAETDVFVFSSFQTGTPGLTPNGFYVWGVNRGAGVAAFAPNGITGVLFDAVVILRPDRTGSVGGTPLPPGSVTIVETTITGVVSGALLPSTGFSKSNYTFNLWPRDGSFTGFEAIADFAPNNANFTSVPVPEPSALLLMALGVVAVLALRR